MSGFALRTGVTAALLAVPVVAAGVLVSHVSTQVPGTIRTSTGRVAHLGPHGCYTLHQSETDLGMALRYCPKEIKR